MTSTSLVGNRRVLEYEGSNFLRLRLVLATLSGKPIRIRNIRAKSTMPGLTESEASLIRLFDKITNGSKLEVNETGTSLYYQPGMNLLRPTRKKRCIRLFLLSKIPNSGKRHCFYMLIGKMKLANFSQIWRALKK
jgi:hypothetical protein